MCGLVGVWHYADPDRPIDAATFDRMTDSLAHRGPDGRGVLMRPGVSLGHRRLAIIDLSEAAAQPMRLEKEGLTIVYNGEIYNFRELRAELESAGRSFRSQSDTEVLLQGYAVWGEDVLNRLNGIFAFAIWDDRRSSIFIARDRMGVKPLYYHDNGRSLWFASEIKAIISDSSVPRALDYEGLNALLAFGFTYDPLTCFSGICKLPPASLMRCDAKGIRVKKYWTPSPAQTGILRFEEAVEECDHLLNKVVKRQMISDVPLGVFLSGGVDSFAIARAMRQSGDSMVDAYTAGFPTGWFDERKEAASSAKAVGVRHHIYEMDIDVAQTIESVVRHCEDPLADSSAINFYHLSRFAGSNLKVALSGDGADELMAGYTTYLASYLAGVARVIPSPLLRWAATWIEKRAATAPHPYSKRQILPRFLRGVALGSGLDHASWRRYVSETTKWRILKPEALQLMKADPLEVYAGFYQKSPGYRGKLGRMLWADMFFYLPSDMLAKVDRMSMAHGLEVRVPFLDNEFVDFTLGLSPSHLIGLNGKGKRILRRMVRKAPSSADVARRPKHGFNFPMSEEFRGKLYNYFYDVVGAQSFREGSPFDVNNLLRLADKHHKGLVEASFTLYTALVFAVWWKLYMDVK